MGTTHYRCSTSFSQLEISTSPNLRSLLTTYSAAVVLYRPEIKNQWARDDPAFLVVLSAFVLCTGLAYAVAFGVSSTYQLLRVTLGLVLVELIGLGWVLAGAARCV